MDESLQKIHPDNAMSTTYIEFNLTKSKVNRFVFPFYWILFLYLFKFRSANHSSTPNRNFTGKISTRL